MTLPDARPREYSTPQIQLHDLKPRVADMREEVLEGLAQRPRRIAPKYFYDQRGSELFDAITRLPEYYLTRTEMALLHRHRNEIRELLGGDGALLEYGSGTSDKIRLLLETISPAAYLPVDISRKHLQLAAQELAADHPGLEVHAICADYTRPLELPTGITGLDAGLTGFFPGSSIGNFEPAEATAFLAGVCQTLGPGNRLLIGVDRRKDPERLERAYNDQAAVTAAFNRNVLLHLNRELSGTLQPEHFAHRALYDAELGRIEMHLEATCDMAFKLAGQSFEIRAGERVHTESSYKYEPDSFLAMASACGFDCEAHWTDADALFSVFVLVTRA